MELIPTENWEHLSPDGMATNRDPGVGGIIDKNIDGWFVIFNNDRFQHMEGFATKAEAFEAMQLELYKAGF